MSYQNAFTDPLLANYLGFASNGNGSVTANATGFTTVPGFDLSMFTPTPSTPVASSSTSNCPAGWPAWLCGFINAVPGSAQAGAAGNATGKAITGKDNATTNDVANALLPNAQKISVYAGIVLLAVVIIALGIWTVVKD